MLLLKINAYPLEIDIKFQRISEIFGITAFEYQHAHGVVRFIDRFDIIRPMKIHTTIYAHTYMKQRKRQNSQIGKTDGLHRKVFYISNSFPLNALVHLHRQRIYTRTKHHRLAGMHSLTLLVQDNH